MAKILRCITQDATVMAMAMDSTDIVSEAERIHQTSAVVTAALGRTMTATSMMGIMLKGTKESVTVRFEGDGPAGLVLAVSDGTGNVRGYVSNPVVEIPLRPDGKLDVGSAIGKTGQLTVIRDLGEKEPYSGCVPLVSGEVAEDITSYYAYSEQIPTVCALGVLVNPDLSVKAAGGLFLQLLPYCPEDVIDKIEENIKKLPPISELLAGGASPEDIVKQALDGFAFDVVDTYEPSYTCKCSRERVEKTLLALPLEERESLPNEEGVVEVCCNFCDKKYVFTKEDLKNLK